MNRFNQFILLILATTFTESGSAHAADLLDTHDGWAFGLQISNYEYDEPRFAKFEGGRLGATLAYTNRRQSSVFLRVDGRLSVASLNYEGSGTFGDVPDYIGEARVTGGRDLRANSTFSWAPYVGLGYRYLYNDFRGITSTGAVGYRRFSNYLYIPLGVTIRVQTSESWTFATSLEYDALIAGRQKSKLSDTGLGFSDITNDQDKGHGYRIDLMVETGGWSFGPWVHYWDIEDSDIATDPTGSTFIEPANTTLEYGLQLRSRF